MMSVPFHEYSMYWLSDWLSQIQEKITTTVNTSPVIATTSLVFRRMGRGDDA